MEEAAAARSDKFVHGELTSRILGCAIEVHRVLGPGMLESAYRICLVDQFRLEGLSVVQEQPVSVQFKGRVIETAYRADLIVEDKVLIELKSVEGILPVHEAQVLSYLKFLKLRVGLLLNFNVPTLRRGMKRFVR